MKTCNRIGCHNEVDDSKDFCNECLQDGMEGHLAEPSQALEKQIGGRHYKKHSIQPWHIIDEYELDFYLGNAIKYILRNKNDMQVEDLEKAIHYLERKIELLKENPKQGKLCLE